MTAGSTGKWRAVALAAMLVVSVLAVFVSASGVAAASTADVAATGAADGVATCYGNLDDLSRERAATADISGQLNGFTFTRSDAYALNDRGTAFELIEESADTWTTNRTFSIVGGAEGLTYSDASGHFFVTDNSGTVTQYNSSWVQVAQYTVADGQVDAIDYSPRYNKFMVQQHVGDSVHIYDRSWNEINSRSIGTRDSVAGLFYDNVYAFEFNKDRLHEEWDWALNRYQSASLPGPDSLKAADIDVYGTGEVYLFARNGTGNVYSFDAGITPVDAPVASDGSKTTDEDTSLSVADGNSTSLLELATDPDGASLSFTTINQTEFDSGTPVTLGSGATVTVNSNGSWTYDPNGQFENLNKSDTATDIFTYTVTDGNGQTDCGRIVITVTGVDDDDTDNNTTQTTTVSPTTSQTEISTQSTEISTQSTEGTATSTTTGTQPTDSNSSETDSSDSTGGGGMILLIVIGVLLLVVLAVVAYVAIQIGTR